MLFIEIEECFVISDSREKLISAPEEKPGFCFNLGIALAFVVLASGVSGLVWMVVKNLDPSGSTALSPSSNSQYFRGN